MATINGDSGNNTLDGTENDDTITGFEGNDTVTGNGGNDTAVFNVTTDGADASDLGAGSDVVAVSADAPTAVRLMFTSAQVGNGNVNDSNSMANQDGGLAVRLQAENGVDGLTGPLSRFDDEGITFVGGAGVTFDVRDLVSGVQRGNLFEVVTLGTLGADTMTAVQAARPYYFNAGMGDDTITGGAANDFLVGGAGLDALDGGAGNDSFIGGGGNDTITGGLGNDNAIFNASTDGADAVNLGDGSDVVNVTLAAPGQIRLMFTSAQVGNGNVNDSNSMANQDGGLAVRLQAEDGSDALTGPISRFDDEGITFVGGAGVTFDVRDLVSGVQRGDAFEVVTLGTAGADTLTAVQATRSYYFNAGMGDDSITGGGANDFLVGGAGNDTLAGAAGNDTYIGGAGGDRFTYVLGDETGSDTITDFQKVDLLVTDALLRDANRDGRITFGGNSVLNLDGGDDTVAFTGLAPKSGLRFLGALDEGGFAYADAATRPSGATEGTTADEAFSGAAGAKTFFFDTALAIGFGDDAIADFGTDDLLVTTTAIVDLDGDGRIAFGSDRTLDLTDGTEIQFNGGALRQLEYDGSVTQNGVEYFVYSRVNTTTTGTDDLFA
jgi:Ca2+-binding RTX toxin-like protein